jgi:hypothetical protein
MFVKPTSVKRAFIKKQLGGLFRVQKREDDIILRGCAAMKRLQISILSIDTTCKTELIF